MAVEIVVEKKQIKTAKSQAPWYTMVFVVEKSEIYFSSVKVLNKVITKKSS